MLVSTLFVGERKLEYLDPIPNDMFPHSDAGGSPSREIPVASSGSGELLSNVHTRDTPKPHNKDKHPASKPSSTQKSGVIPPATAPQEVTQAQRMFEDATSSWLTKERGAASTPSARIPKEKSSKCQQRETRSTKVSSPTDDENKRDASTFYQNLAAQLNISHVLGLAIEQLRTRGSLSAQKSLAGFPPTTPMLPVSSVSSVRATTNVSTQDASTLTPSARTVSWQVGDIAEILGHSHVPLTSASVSKRSLPPSTETPTAKRQCSNTLREMPANNLSVASEAVRHEHASQAAQIVQFDAISSSDSSSCIVDGVGNSTSRKRTCADSPASSLSKRPRVRSSESAPLLNSDLSSDMSSVSSTVSLASDNDFPRVLLGKVSTRSRKSTKNTSDPALSRSTQTKRSTKSRPMATPASSQPLPTQFNCAFAMSVAQHFVRELISKGTLKFVPKTRDQSTQTTAKTPLYADLGMSSSANFSNVQQTAYNVSTINGESASQIRSFLAASLNSAPHVAATGIAQLQSSPSVSSTPTRRRRIGSPPLPVPRPWADIDRDEPPGQSFQENFEDQLSDSEGELASRGSTTTGDETLDKAPLKLERNAAPASETTLYEGNIGNPPLYVFLSF